MNLQEYCKTYIDTYGTKNIRRDNNYFRDYADEIISETHWLKRDNFTNRVFCLAYNITDQFLDPISKKSIHDITIKPLYRYELNRVLNFWISQRKFKTKIYPDLLNENYDFNLYDNYITKLKTREILAIPTLINHCWVWCIKKYHNYNLIESNEEAVYLRVKEYESIPLCPESGDKRKFNKRGFIYYLYKDSNTALKSSIRREKLQSREKTKEAIEKTKQTNIEKYGVSCPLLQEHIMKKSIAQRRIIAKNKTQRRIDKENQYYIDKFGKPKNEVSRLEKYQTSCEENFGCTSPFIKRIKKEKENPLLKVERLKKTRETWIKKYGVDNPNKHQDIKNKTKDTVLSRYGSYSKMVSAETKEKYRISKKTQTYNNFTRFADKVIPLFSLEEFIKDYDKPLPWRCIQTGEEYYATYRGKMPAGSLNSTSIEREIHQILLDRKIDYIMRDRTVLDGREIDVYIPSKKVGIECHGDYFHSDLVVSNTHYHLEKATLSGDKGIKLLQFFEHEIQNKYDIVKSIIYTNIFGTKYNIGARKCNVITLSPTIAKAFYNKYHIQGFIPSKVHYGLIYKNRLISCMSFGVERFNKNTKDSWEILRYCTVRNFSVIGGFSKILKHFIKEYTPKQIITFADKRLFTGDVYLKAGFIKCKDTPPSYIYTDMKGNIMSRFECQRHKLQRLYEQGTLKSYDPGKTEREIMGDNKYARLFDAGCHKFIYTLL
jgi:hypothetical protein